MKLSIFMLCIIVFTLGATLVRIENQRYAMMNGMCRDNLGVGWDNQCLSKIETRTHWVWHLYHAVID
jgi:hypothetical protein